MAEKTPKKEVTNPEIIARLAAMKAYEAAERKLDAQFPPKLKPVAVEAAADSAVAVSAVPESTPVALPTEASAEKVEVPGQGAAKPIRRRNKKSDLMKSEPVAEADEPVAPVAVAASVAVPENNAGIDESGMLNPFSPRRRGKDALAATQKEMDRLAEMSPSDGALPEEKKIASETRSQVPQETGKKSELVIAVSEKSDGETLYNKIDRLSAEAEDLRSRYVKEDFENTTASKKFASLFRLKIDANKGEWRSLYEEKIAELQKAEVEMMQGDMAGAGTTLSEKDTREGMSKLLRYYKLDEQTNLINERTQYRAGHQKFSEQAMDMFGALGRAYNRLSFEKKILLTAALAGVAVVAGAAGGAATSAAAGLMLLKRAAASAGLAVGTEALLEKHGDSRRMSKADTEVKEQLASLEGTFSEQDFSSFEKMLAADIFYSDTRLQEEKRAKTYRKLGAATLGIAVGSGWLSQIVMEKLGGAITFESSATSDASSVEMWNPGESMGETAEGTAEAAEIVPQKMELPDEVTGPNDVAKLKAAAEYMAASPEVQAQIREVSGMTDEQLRTLISSGTKNMSEKFQDILSGSYEVKQGDSVWKILGARAEGLEGAQKTYFIDALKDKVGDIRLEAGEKIDFSEYLTQADVQQAFEEARDLSPDKIASIAVNDVKIAEFAAAHPDVTLTDETVDTILQSKTDAVTSASLGTPADLGVQAAADAKTPFEVSSPAEITPTAAVSPESLVQYGGRVDDWYMQIFRVDDAAPGQDWVFNKEAIAQVKLRDILQDARLFQQGAFSGYATGLDREQITNFAEFFQGVSKESVGFDRLAFFKEYPNATVMDYLHRVAPLVNQGQRIGSLYTTTH